MVKQWVIAASMALAARAWAAPVVIERSVKVAVPLSETDKTTIQRDLRRRETDKQTVTWIAELRKRAWIERRP